MSQKNDFKAPYNWDLKKGWSLESLGLNIQNVMMCAIYVVWSGYKLPLILYGQAANWLLCLFVVIVICLFCHLTDLPHLLNSDLHRQVLWRTSARNVCKHVPWASMYMYNNLFPLPPGAFKCRHHCSKTCSVTKQHGNLLKHPSEF